MNTIAQRLAPAIDRKPTIKRLKTRTRVLNAVMDCIREGGIGAATAPQIAQRCGLSWGVIQYHFGDRTGLLLAILQDAFDALSSTIDDLAREGNATVRQSVEALVDATWSLLRHEDYRVFLEIQLHLSREPSRASSIAENAQEMRRRLGIVWRRSLPEFNPKLVEQAERLSTISLRGLALERAVEPDRTLNADERQVLVDSLISILKPKLNLPKKGKHYA